MTIFQPNNPGLGGLDELTNAEEAFVTSLAGLPYAEDDVLIYQSGSLTNVNHPFVQIAGDTMTGDLVLNDNVKSVYGTGSDSDIYWDGSTWQFKSGTTDVANNVGYIFDTNTFSATGIVTGQDFRIGGESVMQTRWSDILGFGGASMVYFPKFVTFGDAPGFTQGFNGTPFIDAQYTTGGTATALNFQVTSKTGIGSAPTALQGTSVISGSAILSLPKVFIGTVKNTISNSFGTSGAFNGLSPTTFEAYSKSTVGSGFMGYLAEFKARESAFDGGVPVEHAAFLAQNMGAAGGMTASYGLLVENQTGATNNYGIVLNGDGVGSDLVLGAGQDASIYYDGTDLIANPKAVGSGKFKILGDLEVANYSRHISIDIGSAMLGPTAPSQVIIGTASLLRFSANAEKAYIDFEVPNDWVAGTDLTFEIHWIPETAPADTETIKWDISYRSKATGEVLDSGSATTGTVTYTQSGAGTAKEHIKSTITLSYNDANNPLTAGDNVAIEFDRDVTGDTFGGNAAIKKWALALTSNGLAEH